jgi:hypothetical protein
MAITTFSDSPTASAELTSSSCSKGKVRSDHYRIKVDKNMKIRVRYMLVSRTRRSKVLGITKKLVVHEMISRQRLRDLASMRIGVPSA